MKTAVEWLLDEINNIKSSSTNMNGKIQFLEKELNKLFEQAKEMEKRQVIEANDALFSGTAEPYYNETFNK